MYNNANKIFPDTWDPKVLGMPSLLQVHIYIITDKCPIQVVESLTMRMPTIPNKPHHTNTHSTTAASTTAPSSTLPTKRYVTTPSLTISSSPTPTKN